jgi:hypothetical protein
MKWVRAVIRPFCLDDAIAALDAMGIHRLTMTEVQQWCEQTAHAHADENDPYAPIRHAHPDRGNRGDRALMAGRRVHMPGGT